MSETKTERLGNGRLTVLREMVIDHIRREGDTSSFGVRSGLLLDMIRELEERRA